MPNAAEAIHAAAERLKSHGIEGGHLDAEVLLRCALGIDRTSLFVRLREPIAPEDLKRFETLIDRRLCGEPVAYLTGAREFMGVAFSVGPGVLIPRPETESMVEWAAEWLNRRGPQRVVDVGTGSGAIILRLSMVTDPNRNDLFVGVDRSPDALGFAARNRKALGLDLRVQIVLGDLLEWVESPIHLVLANLPYLTRAQYSGNPDLQAEPAFALVSGSDGLEAIDRLVADLPRVLAPAGAAMLELDPSQAAHVAGRLSSACPGAQVSIKRDLQGLDRFVLLERKDAELHN